MDTLKVEPRKGTGKYVAFEMRKNGQVPAIIYGKDTKNELIQVDLTDLEKLLQSGSRILSVDVGGKSQQVILKDVQHDTFAEILHADFRIISKDTKVHVDIAIELTGEANGLQVGAVVEQSLFAVSVECLPDKLPEKIELDVTKMDAETIWFVSNLPKLDGVQYATAPDVAVASCHMPAGTDLEEGGDEEDETSSEPEVIGEKEREEKADG